MVQRRYSFWEWSVFPAVWQWNQVLVSLPSSTAAYDFTVGIVSPVSPHAPNYDWLHLSHFQTRVRIHTEYRRSSSVSYYQHHFFFFIHPLPVLVLPPLLLGLELDSPLWGSPEYEGPTRSQWSATYQRHSRRHTEVTACHKDTTFTVFGQNRQRGSHFFCLEESKQFPSASVLWGHLDRKHRALRLMCVCTAQLRGGLFSGFRSLESKSAFCRRGCCLIFECVDGRYWATASLQFTYCCRLQIFTLDSNTEATKCGLSVPPEKKKTQCFSTVAVKCKWCVIYFVLK